MPHITRIIDWRPQKAIGYQGNEQYAQSGKGPTFKWIGSHATMSLCMLLISHARPTIPPACCRGDVHRKDVKTQGRKAVSPDL